MRFLDPDSGVPLYLQVAGILQEEVAAGRIPPGSKAPSLRALSAEMRVNYHTVSKAYQRLEELGIVEKRRGLGFVVLPAAQQAAVELLLGADVEALVRRARTLGLSDDDLLTRVRREWSNDAKETS